QMLDLIADAHQAALLDAGQIDDARQFANGMREQAADLPGLPQLVALGMAGDAALGAGHVDLACSLLDPVVEALPMAEYARGTSYMGWRYRHPWALALALGGRTEQAKATLTTLIERRSPCWRWLDDRTSIVSAWVSAAQGAVTEAIASVRSAAGSARADGRFA